MGILRRVVDGRALPEHHEECQCQECVIKSLNPEYKMIIHLAAVRELDRFMHTPSFEYKFNDLFGIGGEIHG